MPSQVKAKGVSKGSYIIIDDEPCEIRKVNKSSPGKHGAAKYRIQAEGVFDDRTRNITKPGDTMLLSPSIGKEVGQIVSKDGQMAQVMNMDSYETEAMKLPEDLNISEGEEIQFWDIEGRYLIKGKNDN